MARVAVVHNTLDFRGGADAVCLHACAALAPAHDVTLVTLSATDPERLADRFDVSLQARVRQPPGGPTLARLLGAAGPWLGPQVPARSALVRAALGRADRYDAVLSTTNELALPVPSVQYVHHPQFHRDRLPGASAGPLDRLATRLAAPDPAALAEACLLSNSAWTADVVESVYGVRPEVCHPPVERVEGRDWDDRVAGLLVLGRIAPDKRTLDAVRVFDRLRERGYDLSCRVVGSAPASARHYVARLRRAAAARTGLAVETDVSRERVRDLLGRYRYGLGLKPREHFGMAVAEYVAAGMVPFAPETGGQAEVVGDDRLLFDGVAAAVDRVAAAVDADRRPDLPRDRFSPDRFASAVREHVAAVLG
jgi:glycosyltransferase involved in cell wall biosynthesis